MASDEREVSFSRSGESCVFGKCTAEVRFRVPEGSEELAIKKANEANLSLAEYSRMVWLIGVHGYDEVQRLNQERLKIIAGIGKE